MQNHVFVILILIHKFWFLNIVLATDSVIAEIQLNIRRHESLAGLGYDQPCDLLDDQCDRVKFLHCGISGLCECYNKPETFYDQTNQVCQLLSQAQCIVGGAQTCGRNSFCDPTQTCTCLPGFNQNSQRRCVLEFSKECDPTAIENSYCDPAGFLSCQEQDGQYRCLCDKGDDSWYNSNTRVCHILAEGAECSVINGTMPCVQNSHCDPNRRKCACDSNLSATQERFCFLQHGSACEDSVDLCNSYGYMSCAQGACKCRPENEAKYENSSRTCKLLDGAPCSVFPNSQNCIVDAKCVPAEGSEPHRCQCQYNLQGNKNRECYLMHGTACELSRDLCDREGYLKCGLNNTCECADSRAIYDPILKECRYELETPCSTADGAQPCGKNAHCVNGVCQCFPSFEDAGNGNCLRSYGSACSSTDPCNTLNMLECVRGSCVCTTGYLESYLDDEVSPYDIRCLPGFKMSCSNTTLPCNPEAILRCSNGHCECASPGEQIYQADSQKCGTMVGNRCRPSANNLTNECVDNAVCDTISEFDFFGVCRCDFGFNPSFGNRCTNYGDNLSSSSFVLMLSFFISIISCMRF